jgi:hypothetical protein
LVSTIAFVVKTTGRDTVFVDNVSFSAPASSR